jgi:pyrroloquinoline quinone biosynthesis protein B
MFVQILGSAAGGGFPQWNCNCVNCAGFRDGSLRASAHPVVHRDFRRRRQLGAVQCLAGHPRPTAGLRADATGRALRDGISAIILMDSQIDHTTGLLSLREGCPHQVWCTDMVHEDLSTGFPLFNMLTHWNGGLPGTASSWTPASASRPAPTCVHPPPAQRRAAVFAAPLRPAPRRQHRPDRRRPRTGGKLFYAPGLGKVDAPLLEIMAGSRLPAGGRHAVGRR